MCVCVCVCVSLYIYVYVCVCVYMCVINRFQTLECHITRFCGNCHGVTEKGYKYCLSRDIHFPDIKSRPIIPNYDTEWQQLCRDWPPSFCITTILNIPTTISEVSNFSTTKAMLFLHIFDIQVYIIILPFPKCTYPSGFTIKILPVLLPFFMRPISPISVVIRSLRKIYFVQNVIHESNLYSIIRVTRFRILINVSLRSQVFWDVNLCFGVSGSRHFEKAKFLRNISKHPATQRHIAENLKQYRYSRLTLPTTGSYLLWIKIVVSNENRAAKKVFEIFLF